MNRYLSGKKLWVVLAAIAASAILAMVAVRACEERRPYENCGVAGCYGPEKK